MANRYDIIHIDFQASAKGANAAIESIRQEAKECNTKIAELKKNLAEAPKGTDAKILEGWNQELKVTERRLNQFATAEKELVKGMRALDEGVKMFNDGSLSAMNAAFQKTVNNAAKLAQSKLQTGTKEWRQMGAIMQETEQNYARMQRDTDQLIASLQNGGTVFRKTLEDEKRGLQDLLQVLPYMSTEYRKAAEQLDFLTKKTDEMAIKEKQLRGEIVTTDDARRVSYQLTKKGAEEAKENIRIADKEIASGKKKIEALEKEREVREKNARASAQAAADYRENQQMYEDEIMRLQETIEKEKEAAANSKSGVEGLKKRAEERAKAVEEEKKKQKELDAAYDTAKEKVKGLQEQLAKLTEQQKAAPKTDPATEAIKTGAKKAKKEVQELGESLKMTGEQALAARNKMSEKSTVHINTKSKAQFSNPEEVQQYLMSSVKKIGGINGVSKEGSFQLGYKAQVDQLIKGFQERYGLQGERKDAIKVLKQVLKGSEGGLIAGGKMDAEKGIFRIDPNKDALAARVKKVQELTAVINEYNRTAKGSAATTQEAAAADEKAAESTGKKAKAKKKSAQAGKEESEADRERARLQSELSSAQTLEAKALKDKESQQKKVNSAVEQSNAASEKAKAAEEGYTASLAKNTAELEKNKADLEQLNKDNVNTIATNEKNQQLLAETNAKIAEQGEKIRSAERIKAQAKSEGIAKTEQAIRLLEAENRTIDTNSKQWKNNTKEIRALQTALDEMKSKPALQMMTDRMKNVGKLSTTALEETKKFWQAMYDGADKGSAKLKVAEENLKKLAAEEQKRVTEQGKSALGFFERGEDKNASADQLKQQADALKKYRDSLPREKEAETITKINNYLVQAGAAAERAATQTMSMKDALRTALSARGGNFKGTVEQLTQAKKTLEDLQQKAVKGGLAWRRMQEGIDSINLELQRTGHLSGEVMDILNKPKGKSFNELKQAIEQGRKALASMRTETEADKKAFDDLAAKVKEADFQMKQLAGSSKGTATAFDKAWSRLKTYIGLYVGAAVAMQKIAATMGDLMELSDKMGEVRKTTGWSADEVGRLSDNLKKLDVRTSLVGLLDLSAAAGQLGLKTQEAVEGFTKSANMLTIALPEMGREAATSLVKIADATGDLEKNGGDIEETLQRVGSTIIALRANSASAAPQITDFVKRVGAVGAQAGISIDQIAALGSTIDALGGRVEMSATALSRMIPAIRNNAFGVANAIGVTEKTLTDLFNQGKAMDAMVLIFRKMSESVKRFDTSTEEGTNAMADNVEALLGKNAAMADVMKELNQQGARAGIVFGLLSQNVDKLEDQLKVAGNAYRENTALLNEFNNMNETTAAKWARLKNEFEEMFVGDKAQRRLGAIIDKLRGIIDLLTGNSGLSVALRSIIAYIVLIRLQIVSVAAGALKTLGNGLKNIGVMLGFIKGEMTAIQWGNIFTAAAAAVWLAVEALGTFRRKTAEAFKEAGKWAQQIVDAEQAVESNFKAVEKANSSIDEANKKLKDARAALEKAKKAMDGSKESAERLKKAEDDLKLAEQEVTKARDGHRTAVEKINTIYGKYLGFTLSEISSKKELAAAQELVNSKLREEITLKRRSAALERVEDEKGGGRDEAYGAMSEALGSVFRKQETVNRRTGEKGWANDTARNTELLRKMTKMAQEQQLTAEQIEKALSDAGVSIYETAGGRKRITAYGANLRNLVLDYNKEYQGVRQAVSEVETQFEVELSIDREKEQEKLQKQYQQSEKTYASLEQKHAKATGDAKKQAAADLLKQADTLQDMIKNAGNFYQLDNAEEKKAYDKFISDTQKRIEGIEASREALLKEAGELYQPQAGSSSSTNPKTTNPYGTFNRVTSPYEEWDADSLVARRKEMLERVRTLANGADVQKVMSEDAKFISEAVRNNIKTTKDAIEWYNAERLKIQEALHQKHLTNTGDWKDETEGGRRKPRQIESDYALAELDRYYSRRKEELEKARIEENMSEELFNRQAELLEQEHLERRSKLRETFTAGASEQEKQMVKDFREWWAKLAKTGDLDEVPWATVESEWSKALESQRGLNNLRAQQDMTKLEQITVKHLNAIAKIIDRERPYDGITANLRDNLTKMDILFADLDKQGATDAATLVSEQSKRLSFLLEEAGHAYALTFEQLDKDMREKGFGAWADELGVSEDKKQQILSQLRTAYDAIQEAIKKEASTIKKQTDVLWKDSMPGSQSVKQQYEAAISALGLEQSRVTHANEYVADAGQASERVVDRLAIKQMQVQLAMQEHYYNLMQKIGLERIKQQQDAAKGYANEAASLKAQAEQLRAQGKEQQAITAERQAQVALQKSLSAEQDAKNIATSLEVSMTEGLKKKEEQRLAIANKVAESQMRLYTEMKEWMDLLTPGIKNVFEAAHEGDADYFNERARIRLEGEAKDDNGNVERKKYVVTENEGTKDAKAHYETLSELEYLNRQHEIEVQNAQKDAWRQVMDDFNEKLGKSITDYFNAMQQQAVVDRNTDATTQNTEKLGEESAALRDANNAAKAGTESVNVNTDATQANTNALIGLTNAILEQKSGSEASGETGGGVAGAGEKVLGTGDMGLDESGVPNALKETEAVENPATKNQWVVTEKQAEITVDNVGRIFDAVGQKAVDTNVAATEAYNKGTQNMSQPPVGTNKFSEDDAEVTATSVDMVGSRLVATNVATTEAYNEGTQGMSQPPVGTNKLSEEDAEVTAASVDMVGSQLVETNVATTEAYNEGTQGMSQPPVGTNTVTPEQVEVSTDSLSTLGEEMVKVNTDVIQEVNNNTRGLTVPPVTTTPAAEENVTQVVEQNNKVAQAQINNNNNVAAAAVACDKKRVESAKSSNATIEATTSKTFGQMVSSVNWYGAAYAAMSNDNMEWSQKFATFALQTFGQMLIQMLTTKMAESGGEIAAETPLLLSKCIDELGPIGGPIAYAGLMSVIGGLMGLAASSIGSSKSEIAQATGANNSGNTPTRSVHVGRLATGMLTYAEGNVNEFTDPGTLTEGRMYNVDAADGKTYRAKYTGRNPRTHITNGPEFHLAGEAGPEAIIDAQTTRQIRFDESGIWRAIKTLSGGGSLSYSTRHKGGVRAFAEGNLEEVDNGQMTGDSLGGVGADQLTALQASIDRQSDLLEYLRDNGIKASFDTYGKYGLVDTYDTAKKTLERYGERY